jgi:hypothetical protein
MIKVNGAWYLDALPIHIVVEKENGELAKYTLVPFREIQESELTVYKSYHPRKCKGQPVPIYLYRFYGLVKNEESASEVIHVRLTPTEKSKLQDAAGEKNVSEFIRE